jgi:LysR family hca operon transcriptional activator
MQLRHLRYFMAAAEMGNLTEAAERRLHTLQPSLSRQIRDLEYQVGADAGLCEEPAALVCHQPPSDR